MNDNKPDDEIVIRLNFGREDTENVTFVPSSWNDMARDGKITGDALVAGVKLLAAKMTKDISLEAFTDRVGLSRLRARDAVNVMVSAGILLRQESPLMYDVNPIYVYDPATGGAMA